MGFAMKLRLAIRIVRWLGFASLLAGLGTLLYFVIPPTPRWTLDLATHAHIRYLADGRFLLVRTPQDEWQVRERRDGAVIFSCAALPNEWLNHRARFSCTVGTLRFEAGE